jgi:diguanylate cyclase (GGDEF)-like protein
MISARDSLIKFRDTVATAGESELDAGESKTRFNDIGLPETAGWYVSAVLYWVAGCLILATERLAPENVSDGVAILAVIALAMTPVFVYGANHWTQVWWGPHLRILSSLVLIGIGVFFVGDTIGAIGMIVVLPILATAYLHRWRIALPYAFIGWAIIVLGLMFDPIEGSDVRMIVSGGLVIVLTIGVIFIQERLRKAALYNHSLSVTDPLTGLSNIRELSARLRQEIQRATRTGSKVVLFAIDLDDFKQVNDGYSYELGDRVLKRVAQELQTELEPADLLVRRGGDEFAVLTIATDDRDLDELEARMSAAIVRARTAVCPEVNPNASIGFILHSFGETAEEMLTRLDDSLHDAKLVAHPERRFQDITDADARERAAEAVEREDDSAPFGGGQVQMSSFAARIVSDFRDVRPVWWFATLQFGFLAVALAAIVFFDMAPDLDNQWGYLATGMAFASAFASWVYSLRRSNMLWLHLPTVLAFAAALTVLIASTESTQALVELLALPVPLMLYCLGLRHAAPYAAVSIVAYPYFLIQSDYPYTLARCAAFGIAGLVMCAMLVRGQKLSAEFASHTQNLTVTDPLTRVANLRGLHRRVQDEINRCNLVGGRLALVMVDLDGFKYVNDRHNHTVGDAVLVETARAMQTTVREDELVARRGGDEFAIVCVPDATSDLDNFCERVAASIEKARYELTPDVPATATVTHVYWQVGEGAEVFLRRADEELHRAKAAVHAAGELHDSLA